MKKVLAILLAACLALSLAACGGSGSSAPVSTAPDTSGSAPASAPAAADGSIAVFYYTYSDTYISTVRTALDAELDKLGVEYQDYDSNSQQNTQTEQVDTAITKGATLPDCEHRRRQAPTTRRRVSWTRPKAAGHPRDLLQPRSVRQPW